MGVIRAEPARVTDWAAKSVGAAWRAFDLQLATYAALLAAIGLVMAYTNSVESGSTPLEAGTDVHPRPDVGRHRRRRLHRSPPRSTTAGSRPWPGRSTRLQLGLLVLTLADRRRRRRIRSLDRVRPVHVPVQRAREDPDDHRAGPTTSRAARAGSIHCATILGACVLVGPPLAAGDAPAGPRDVARLRGDPRRDALDVGREPEVAGRPRRRRSSRWSRSRGRTSCWTTRRSD